MLFILNFSWDITKKYLLINSFAALRMGKVNTKVAVAKILANFDLIEAPRKEVKFRFDPAPTLVTEGGLNVRLSKRKDI